MATQPIIVETAVPEDVFLTLQAHGLSRDSLGLRSQQLLALRFYQERLLSLGKAARLAGMSRWEFIDFLAANDVPVIDFSDDELAAEFAAVDRLEAELER